MELVIKYLDNRYAHQNGKIILFESNEVVHDFLNRFQQYAHQRLLSEGRLMEIMALQNFLNQIQVIEKDFKETPPCGVITYKEVRESYGI